MSAAVDDGDADYVSTGRDYETLSLGGYGRPSCYAAAAAAATGPLSSHPHPDNTAVGGRSSVGELYIPPGSAKMSPFVHPAQTPKQ